jgi:hypothetical protein
MNIQLSVDGAVTDIPGHVVSRLALCLDGSAPSQRKALIHLAHHCDYEVRAAVASKPGLSKECYLRLANDSSIDVLSSLLQNPSFHCYALMSAYQKIVERDPRLRHELSMCLDMVKSELRMDLGRWLISLDDYKVRRSMANSIRTPAPLLRLLADDPAPDVAETARRRLARLEGSPVTAPLPSP